MAPRVWFITGASTGFGRDMTEWALKQGDIVVASARKPESLDDLKTSYAADQLLTIRLDVDKATEIKQAFVQAKNAFGRVDVVFNNAGWSVVGEIEAVPEDEARKLFDTNFWGASNVSREAVRFFREENRPSGGFLIVTSSVVGVQATAGGGYYSASKHALEGLTESLALEVDPSWNIKVSLVEPGFFRTPIIAKFGTGYSHPAYTSPSLPSVVARSFLANNQGTIGADPTKAVRRIYDLTLLQDPPLRLVLGKRAVHMVKEKAKHLEQDAVKYESWSEELEFDD